MKPPAPLTPEQRAQMLMQQQIQARTNRSIFNGAGKLDEGTARELATKQDVYLGEYLHLDAVPWAPDPDGSEHCMNLARLVEYMGELPGDLGGVIGGPLSKHDRKVLHAVAMLYCVGKGSMGEPGGKALGQEGYAQRSAQFAEKFFREGGGFATYWSKEEVREDVCKLIYRHNDERAIGEDKRLQVFADAVRYELARIAPNTQQGISLLQTHCRPELFHLGWSKTKENFRAWMCARGWR